MRVESGTSPGSHPVERSSGPTARVSSTGITASSWYRAAFVTVRAFYSGVEARVGRDAAVALRQSF